MVDDGTHVLIEEQPQAFDEVFGALSHHVRRGMVGRLADRELTVGELAEPLAMSFEAASKHVRVLERAGLIHRTVEGRRHVCRLEPGPLASAAAWLRFYERLWATGLDSLDELLRPIADDPEQGRLNDRESSS